ncbi:periodic tryptophan protein 1 homolog [Branchiostoma floridae]|uniref:Periodic tryptophan protein 1 homolog n=1 Tax=Branchiostoma floridae TaxID=7739 RepID=A0A9J7MSY4_BRAFL|nr:periodic tryptophan protein 1 homolog [Branchiostoma floridae]
MTSSVVTCLAWVPRGVAKAVPDKVQVDKEELQRLIKETSNSLKELEDEEKEEQDVEDVEMEGGATGGEDAEDDLAEFNLDNYDDDPAGSLIGNLASLTVYASNDDDPYITVKEDAELEEEEREDFTIKSSDNLVIVGRAEEDCSILEVYIYNEDEKVQYVHHDLILPAFPLALEWMNFDPGEDKPGNLVAVGSVTPGIDIWDLDVVDSLEPVVTLGSHKKKPSKKKKKVSAPPRVGHTDAVLDLSWNRLVRNILASASADRTVALWDLSQGKPVTTLSQHKDKVQTLEWHPFEAQSLLSGGFDKHAILYDCRSPKDSHKSWVLSGEVERVMWNHFSPFHFLASTDDGFVYNVDIRTDKPVFTLSAHPQAVTGLSLSSAVPGCLVTTSSDKTLKVWDIQDNKPALMFQKEMKMGGLTCARSCPDSPFLFAMGGEKDSLRVWSVMDSGNTAVQTRFEGRPRPQLPTQTPSEMTSADQPEM